MSLWLQNVRAPLAEFSLEVDLELNAHVTAFFGPSGAGKTALLDVIAGLRRPVSAVVRLGGTVLTDTIAGVSVPPHRRGIGYVPQDLALFPHLSVRDNLLYGRRRGADSNPRFGLDSVAAVLDLRGVIGRDVRELSGGEKQRVALARAVLSAPQLLLLDEPLASLDAPLKERILPYLRRVRETYAIPMVYVSHDPGEVAALCDEAIVFSRGRVLRRGLPGEVLHG